ncbi:hypothetical protein TNCV_4770461 [Trichonephila clavipes]|nr:hypothetical protein TNCV_4770461 [Trichonephila clavipes]
MWSLRPRRPTCIAIHLRRIRPAEMFSPKTHSGMALSLLKPPCDQGKKKGDSSVTLDLCTKRKCWPTPRRGCRRFLQGTCHSHTFAVCVVIRTTIHCEHEIHDTFVAVAKKREWNHRDQCKFGKHHLGE